MTAEITPRPATVELVQSPSGEWVPAPFPRRGAAVRSWLRVLLSPTPPEAYLSSTEVCVIRTRLHWVVPLRRIAQAAVSMPLAIALSLLASFVLPGAWWLQALMWLGTIAHQVYLGYLVVAWRVDQIWSPTGA